MEQTSKIRKVMYYVTFPLVIIGMISFIVILFILLLSDKTESWNGWIILGSICGGCFILALLAYLIFFPFVKKKETEIYNALIDLTNAKGDFDSINRLYPVLGFDEFIKIQNNGLYFAKSKTLMKYKDVELEILHKEIFGQKNNYIKIIVNRKQFKNFPSACFIDFSKDLVVYFLNNNVEVGKLEDLKLEKKVKEKKKAEIIYRYPIYHLIIKIILSIALLAAGMYLMLNDYEQVYAYLCFIPFAIIWVNNSKNGKLIFTKDSIICKNNFVKNEIHYDEIINCNIDKNKLVISSPFEFISFYANEEIVNEITKRVNAL